MKTTKTTETTTSRRVTGRARNEQRAWYPESRAPIRPGKEPEQRPVSGTFPEKGPPNRFPRSYTGSQRKYRTDDHGGPCKNTR